MRTGRFKAPEHTPVAYYHCLSRVVDRVHRLGEVEKECFVKLMRRFEDFGGLQVVTYCVMSNHFHILVEVPRRPKVLPSDKELIEKLKRVYEDAGEKAQYLKRLRAMGAHEEAEHYRETFFCRMWDVSEFIKSLKQNFSQWYNHENGRTGTLWEGRFKSVLVEGAGGAVLAMAAYIDLNPVRARMVNDPKDYRWCGYAEAVAGGRLAMAGLTVVAEAHSNIHGGFDRHGNQVGYLGAEVQTLSLGECRQRALTKYRVLLFETGEENGLDANGHPLRRGFSQEQIQAVLTNGGKLSLFQALHCRVRYFADGAVLGSRAFVESIFNYHRHRFGAKRTSGARPMREIEECELMTCRALRHGALG